jgi:hypothetical protein
MLTSAAHALIYNAFQHGDTSGLPEFIKQARGRRAKEIASHVANFAGLQALYERTADGEADAVCVGLEAEEDWFATQLRF